MLHKVSGTTSIEEIGLAIQHTLQHSELPVIWDLQELHVDEGLREYESNLRSLIERSRSGMSSEKRAFVVTAYLRDSFEKFLGGLHLPWTWAVFEESDAAIDWLKN